MDSFATNWCIQPFSITNGTGNIGSRWEEWLGRFENYLCAADISEDKRKSALLLHLAGEEIFDLYGSLPVIEETVQANPNGEAQGSQQAQAGAYETTKNKLKLYFAPKINKNFEIFKFRETSQQQGETLDQYYARLLKL